MIWCLMTWSATLSIYAFSPQKCDVLSRQRANCKMASIALRNIPFFRKSQYCTHGSTGGSRLGLERLRRNWLFAYLDFSAVKCNDRMKFLWKLLETSWSWQTGYLRSRGESALTHLKSEEVSWKVISFWRYRSSSRLMATSCIIYMHSMYCLLISGVTTCDNFTVGLCVETIINHLVSEGNRTGSELISKFRILLYRNNDTNLQIFIARFHKIPDTIVAKDPVESILLQDPSDSSTRPHSPSVKGNLNDISLSWGEQKIIPSMSNKSILVQPHQVLLALPNTCMGFLEKQIAMVRLTSAYKFYNPGKMSSNCLWTHHRSQIRCHRPRSSHPI